MKTVQDWGFISKEQGLVKPKLQENKIFHALTSAYENNQQQEICGATENIVRREKELCEMALADLQRLAAKKGEGDATLHLIMEHYQSRLLVAREKEEKINHLSEDSRKMMEEYKKKTSELADVKRSLMESQGKLRELAKTTEKLLKREEELRFIETNLRSEIDKNKTSIINGLYEIVSDLQDSPPGLGDGVSPDAAKRFPAASNPASPKAVAAPPLPTSIIFASAAPAPDAASSAGIENAVPPRNFQQGLFRQAPPLSGSGRGEAPKETIWTRDVPAFANAEAPSAKAPAPFPAPAAPSEILKPGDLLEKALRLKMFEPGKSLCSKSMVKNAEGEVISEYFYSPLHAKDSRHYIFNALFGISSLLALKAKDEDFFLDRLETLFTDLLSRLEHSRNIHLEGFLGEELNRSILDNILSIPNNDRPAAFEALAARVLARVEAVGPARAGLIDHQFRTMPRSDFPPENGISA